jgi:plastocyanin
MATGTLSKARKTLVIGILFILPLSGLSLAATNHVIQFGGSLGFAYSPKSLAVVVNDTVTWVGDFGFHPLSSTTIPAGATPFSNGSGSSFKYVVTVAGTYDYQCDNHGVTDGMVGSFTASITGINTDEPSNSVLSFHLEQNFPNPFNPSTVIAYSLPTRASVSLTVYNTLGGMVAELSNGLQEAGHHHIAFDGSGLSSGVYFYRLQARESPTGPQGETGRLLSSTKTLLLLK